MLLLLVGVRWTGCTTAERLAPMSPGRPAPMIGACLPVLGRARPVGPRPGREIEWGRFQKRFSERGFEVARRADLCCDDGTSSMNTDEQDESSATGQARATR